MVKPGKTVDVSIPILAAGEITGMVTISGKDIPEREAPGLDLILLDEEGKEVARTQTEFDGFYSIAKVSPGKYRLMPDPKRLRIFQAHFILGPIKPEPPYHNIIIPVSVEPAFIDDVNFKLIRK